MKLHHATETDLEQVVSWIDNKLDCRIWGGPSVSYPIELQTLIEEINFSRENSYVFKAGKNVAAFGQVIQMAENSTHLARIITCPGCRGRGYGFDFCKALIATANKSGRLITLNVYRNNTAAMALYEKLGFVEDKDKSTKDTAFMVKT